MTQFATLLRALHREQVEFIVIGGVAMVSRGGSRLTNDLDVAYERSAPNLERDFRHMTDGAGPSYRAPLLNPPLQGAPMIRIAACVVFFCGVHAIAQEENPWELQRTEPILIKTRARAGTAVKEVWAEGDLAALPIDIQDTLTDAPRFIEFMPYMTESRFVGATDPDGAVTTYSKLDVPVLSSRDFVHKAYLDRDARTDKEGVFANHWLATPDRVPERPSVIRLKISEGSWQVTPWPGGGSSHVVYRLCVDPAGSVPAYFANRANANGLTDTFKNIEHEAQRRQRARVESAQAQAGSSPRADLLPAPKR